MECVCSESRTSLVGHHITSIHTQQGEPLHTHTYGIMCLASGALLLSFFFPHFPFTSPAAAPPAPLLLHHPCSSSLLIPILPIDDDDPRLSSLIRVEREKSCHFLLWKRRGNLSHQKTVGDEFMLRLLLRIMFRICFELITTVHLIESVLVYE